MALLKGHAFYKPHAQVLEAGRLLDAFSQIQCKIFKIVELVWPVSPMWVLTLAHRTVTRARPLRNHRSVRSGIDTVST